MVKNIRGGEVFKQIFHINRTVNYRKHESMSLYTRDSFCMCRIVKK